jgi:hypothetical protein
MTNVLTKLEPKMMAIIEAAIVHVRRDAFRSDVTARLRPLDQPDYSNVRAAVSAALTLYGERK